ESLNYCSANLVGLFIQCYDAGRGILSNSMLHLERLGTENAYQHLSEEDLSKYVTEVMRFDPTVHHTRREAKETIILNNHKIMKGQSIILFLAAANRDPLEFVRPQEFDPCRINNHSLLSFGSGMHACLAGRYSIRMTAQAIYWLLQKFRKIEILEKQIEFERLYNLRLPKQITLHLKE
ncbi:MAG TPA: cytochrome P450, partial [Puia sp.]|nr:cytochrome P450 [Puia sp.]